MAHIWFINSNAKLTTEKSGESDLTFYRTKSKQYPKIHMTAFLLTFTTFELIPFLTGKSIPKKLHNVSRDFFIGTYLHIVFLFKKWKHDMNLYYHQGNILEFYFYFSLMTFHIHKSLFLLLLTSFLINNYLGWAYYEK